MAPSWPGGRRGRAPCGGFFAELEGGDPCLPGSWQTPGRRVHGLDAPRLAELYDTLRDYERRHHGDGDLSFRMLIYAADMLRTGLVPADLRAALYRMLGWCPACGSPSRSRTSTAARGWRSASNGTTSGTM